VIIYVRPALGAEPKQLRSMPGHSLVNPLHYT
jgi:hypothetical protein